jgi:acetylcholinesterase
MRIASPYHTPLVISVGPLRFSLPQALASYNGSINGTAYGASCMQQSAPFPVSLRDIFGGKSIPSIPFMNGGNKTNSTDAQPQSEDCETFFCLVGGFGCRVADEVLVGLTINVIKPANVSADSNLPVVVVRMKSNFWPLNQ